MIQSTESTGRRARLHVGDAFPSPAADAELRWFFNEAESAVDLPSNFVGLLTGDSPTSLEAVERRAEALHSAGKIRARLLAIPLADARALESLYREQSWPPRLEGALGVLAGPVATLPVVRVAHLRALLAARTREKSLTAWLEERLTADRQALAAWRREAERSCRIAVVSYERTRGTGPSVVPEEESEGEDER